MVNNNLYLNKNTNFRWCRCAMCLVQKKRDWIGILFFVLLFGSPRISEPFDIIFSDLSYAGEERRKKEKYQK